MSSKIDRPIMRSAAWRISLWASLAFAMGTMAVFVFLHRFVASDIQRRSDAWLSGEVEVLGDVAERTPQNTLYDRVVGEVAELAAREVPYKLESEGSRNDAVFFLQEGEGGDLRLWVGAGTGQATLNAIQQSRIAPDQPTDLRVSGFSVPFRVAKYPMKNGSRIYLGLSERDELRVLRSLRIRFLILWLVIVLLGFSIVFFTTRRMLSHVRRISEAASGIGHSDVHTRVPTTGRHDEVAHLALTLNGMLDRIENSMHQLHTITDSLAHDLRSPLTAIRGQLEMSLTEKSDGEHSESIVSAIEELDRLAEFLNTSLDVAEAKADALRLTLTQVDLDRLLRSMVDLYEPCMSERGLQIRLESEGPLIIEADAALIHRMIANLLDNELKHLPAARRVVIQLRAVDDRAELILDDNGPGFSAEVLPHLFEQRVKGKESKGHGLGLAFVEAVARTHGGSVVATNLRRGGAQIKVAIPLTSQAPTDASAPLMLAAE
jgi:signal transduction histidine kinase